LPGDFKLAPFFLQHYLAIFGRAVAVFLVDDGTDELSGLVLSFRDGRWARLHVVLRRHMGIFDVKVRNRLTKVFGLLGLSYVPSPW
jgi:hypothetical protein